MRDESVGYVRDNQAEIRMHVCKSCIVSVIYFTVSFRKAPRHRNQNPFRVINIVSEDYFNPFDHTYFTSLHKKESAEIVINLDSHLEDIKRVLNNCLVNKDMKMSMLMLKTIEKALCCDSMPHSLQRIYDVLIDEEFIQFVITEFMLISDCVEIQNSFAQLYTERLIIMCSRCFELFPSSLSTLFGFYDLLLQLVSSFHSERKYWITLNTSGIYKAFTKLTESKCQLLKNWIRHDFLEKGNSKVEPGDQKNFRKINIIPGQSRSYISKDKYLQKNKTEGAYDDLEQYLDIQFRLLREDFMTPLRKGLDQYLDTTSSTERQHRNPYIRVYRRVYIRAPACKRELTFTVEFDASKLKKVNWEHSKWLIHGALICLSSDNFKTIIYGTIAEREPASLKQGKIRVKFENCIKNIRLLDETKYTMIETNALFEAYRHVLLALQRTKDIPFKDYILKCQSDILPPKYLRHKAYNQFDLSPLIRKRVDVNVPDKNRLDLHTKHGRKFNQCEDEDRVNYENVDILDSNDWPNQETLQLDDSQFDALRTALTKEISIIQGPPGTGKTYIGLQIVKVLLKNHEAWSFRMMKCRSESSKHDTQCHPHLSADSPSCVQDIRESKSGDIATDAQAMNCPSSSIEGDFPPCMSPELALNDITSDAGKKHRTENRLESACLLSSDSEDIQDDFIEDLRPILIMCNTNHALDQFLEGIAEFHQDHILRIGGRSKSKSLEQYNLSNIRTVESGSSPLAKNIKDTNRNIYKLKRTIASLALELDWLQENIMHIGCLTNGSPTVNKQLEADYNNRSKDYEENCTTKGDTKLLRNSPTVIWLRLFEKMDEIVRLRKRPVSSFYVRFNAGKSQKPRNCRLYDMSVESDSFVKDLREELSGTKIAFEIHTGKCLKGSIEEEFLKYLRDQLMSTDVMSDEEEEYMADNIRFLSTNDRWRLYRKWMSHRRSEIVEETKANLVELEKATLRRAELDMQKDKQIMQKATIIGMTTTCAAKYHMILNEVKPRIIIIEEAAAVFESHIIASLNPACDQLVLIGDHKQLRPAPATYGLAARYNFDVSLFERMVENEIQRNSLKIQHRMRPSIAKLIRQIYPDLLDHKSVQNYKNIKGLSQNMYFVSHEYEEFYDKDQTTYSNQPEAMFAIALSKYISQQGYKPHKITLLTTYRAQLYLLKNLLKKENVYCRDLVVTVVDKYQGEENDIVVLSLVRSNIDGNIGFLEQANRICVALSRAKKGLYIIGNARKLAEQSTLWGGIINDLKKEQLIGKGLLLYCQNHPEKKIHAITCDDFKQAPEGGCQETCDIRLCCGHVCERKCHILDSSHRKVNCQKRCIRKCKNGHRCSKRCNEPCGHCSEMIIETLRCGHIKCLPCHIDLQQYICDEVCNKKLQCGHTCKRKCGNYCYPCHVSSSVSLLKCRHEMELKCCQSDIPVCQRKCDKKLECGHNCIEICGNVSASYQQLENEAVCSLGHKIICNERCDSTLVCRHKCKGKCTDCFGKRLHLPCYKRCNCDLVCGHTCEGLCEDCFPCERSCEISCSHHRCNKSCKDQCQKCQQPCEWECPHLKCTALCGELCNRPRCDKPCREKLKCGHKCIGLCGERCPAKCFICNKDFLKSKGLWKSESQTNRLVELQECNHLVEYKTMDAYMDEKETPVRFKRCPECTKPIRMSLRYNNVVKHIQSKVEKLKCAVPALTKQNDLLNNIGNSNIQNTRSVIDAIDTYFCSEANVSPPEIHTILNTIILSGNYVELCTQRRHLFSHQTILDVSLEIKRYFDKNVLGQLQSILISSVQNVQPDIKSCVETASRVLDFKSKYDQERQKLVEKCITQLRNVLPSVRAATLNLDIIPVADVASIKTCIDGLLCSNLAPVAKSEETVQKLFSLQLFIQKRSTYYNCGRFLSFAECLRYFLSFAA